MWLHKDAILQLTAQRRDVATWRIVVVAVPCRRGYGWFFFVRALVFFASPTAW